MKQSICLSVFSIGILTLGFSAKNKNTYLANEPAGAKKEQKISFTENKGQVHDQDHQPRTDVLYGAMAGDMAVHIKNSGVSYQLYRVDKYKELEDPKTKEKREVIDQQTIYRVDLNWLNHNTNFTTAEDEAIPGFNNYYLENCPNGALHVKSYRGITLKNLYKGINLHYYEKNGELKHDYIVAANADYKQIQLQVDGADVSINKDGSLLLTTPLGRIQEGAPVVYQNGKQLAAKWMVENKTLSFDIKNYNPNYELIIDPVTRLWGTYYGGTGNEESYACTTDAGGNVFMTGKTISNTGTSIATSGSHQSSFGGGSNTYDAFLVKFDANGTRLWGTYYGGTGEDIGYSCATDAVGNVYLAGYTASNTGTAIATPGSHQPAYGGATYDAFLVKFDSGGIRLWGTYYGGTGTELGYSCATDAAGNVYLAGQSSSASGIVVATIGSHQPVYGGGSFDAFLVKFNSSGTRQWATYYGGSAADGAQSCAVDAANNVYMAGTTVSNTSTLIAGSGSHQSAYGGGGDAFLVKFNGSGVRQWGTYYGGTGVENAYFCAADAGGNVYMSGYTDTNTGTAIASPGSHQPTFGGGVNNDAFLVKFDAGGTRQWGTYYGGTGDDRGFSCSPDVLGNVYMAGYTSSGAGTIIATSSSYQSTLGGNYDAYLAKFDAGGIRQWGTYYGAAAGDGGQTCAIDVIGNVYMAGHTISNTGTVIATAGSHQSAYGGGPIDAFLVKFDVCDVAPAQPSAINGPATICSDVAASYSTPLAFGANSYTWSLPGGWLGTSNSNVISATAGSPGIFTLTAGNACGTSPQQTLNVTVNPLPTVVVNSGSICAGQSFTITASGANTYIYSGGPVVSPGSTSSYTVTGTSTLGCSDTAVSSVTVNALPIILVNSGIICAGQSFTIVASGANTYTYSGGPVVSPAVTSSYSVTGTSAEGCASSNTAVSTVTVSTIHPTITVNSGTICVGNSFTIVPGGAGTYTIQGGTSVVSPGTTTSYTVAGTSTAGCVSSNTAVSGVTVNPLPVINVSTTHSLLCVGENATLTAGGASAYTFNPGGSGISITVSPTIASTYTVTGKDTNGCSNTAIITQSVDACTGLAQRSILSSQLSIYPNPTKGIVNLDLDWDHEVVITNGIGQIVYSVKLSAGHHQVNLEHLATGIYVVKVRNAVNSENLKLIKE